MIFRNFVSDIIRYAVFFFHILDWAGPFQAVKSPIEACALGGGGRCKQLIKRTLIKLIYGPLVI